MSEKSNKATLSTTEKYINVLWWISFVLTMLLYIGVFVFTVRCYIPYSFDGAVSADIRTLIYTLISACSVLIIFSMLLSHILKKKLSDIAMIGILAFGCILVTAPMIYKSMPWREASYAISSYTFFMLPLSLLFIFSSFAGEKKARVLGVLTAVLSALIMLIMLAATTFVTVKEPIFDFLCAPMLLPVISSVTVIMSFGTVFGGVLNELSLIRQYVLLGLTSLVSYFGSNGFAHTAFLAVLAIDAVTLCVDIVFYFISTHKNRINSGKETL